MNPRDILDKTFPCECGRTHVVPVRQVLYAQDGLERLPALLTRLASGKSADLVADARTFEAAGRDVESVLSACGWAVRTTRLPDPPHGDPVCDDITLEKLEAALGSGRRLLIAVGSGVVNDLCKWVATKRGLPYMVVATAASMNGYSSANIAPAIKGVKRVIDGVAPFAIVTTPAIIAGAPDRLTAAGLGDVVAKPVSTTDWKVNHLLFSEYYCPLCAQLIRDVEPLYMEHAEGIRRKSAETIEALFSALVYSGISMTLAGTSFPASGGEHMISHVLDMKAGVDGIPHDYHGRQVGVGTIFASALYERLAALDSPEFRTISEDTDRAYWKRLAEVVEEEHARKRERAPRAVERLRRTGTWESVREIMGAGALKASRIKDCLKKAGAAHTLDDIGCDRDRFAQAVRHSHQIRERYTVIDLARAAGILPGAVDEIIDEHLVS